MSSTVNYQSWASAENIWMKNAIFLAHPENMFSDMPVDGETRWRGLNSWGLMELLQCRAESEKDHTDFKRQCESILENVLN